MNLPLSKLPRWQRRVVIALAFIPALAINTLIEVTFSFFEEIVETTLNAAKAWKK